MNEIISASLEDYLEAVFLLSECRESVRVTDIAAFLKIYSHNPSTYLTGMPDCLR